jgi:hypothetical protein
MKLPELQAEFYRQADDRSVPPFFKGDVVTAWLNEAVEEAAIRSRLLFERTDATLCEYDIQESEIDITIDDRMVDLTKAILVDAGDEEFNLDILDREELERLYPNWRTTTEQPRAIAYHDNRLQLNCKPDTNYTLRIEGYRLPLKAMKSENDKPEIHSQHHRRLVDWALFRAFQIPDTETFNPEKSAEAESRFNAYFGTRPNANARKRQTSNRPHHVKAYW